MVSRGCAPCHATNPLQNCPIKQQFEQPAQDLLHQRVLTIDLGSGVGCLDDVGELAFLEMKTDPPR